MTMGNATRKLVCACGEWSADAGDYFWMPAGKVFHCNDCGDDMALIVETPYYSSIGDDEWIAGKRVQVLSRHATVSMLD